MAGFSDAVTTGAGRIARFILVGAATAAVYFSALVLLVEGAGLSPSPAAAVAYLAAIAANYFGQKLVTFRNRTKHRVASFRYAAVIAILMGANSLGMAILPSWAGISYLQAQLAVSFVMFAASYLAQRFWIFGAD